MANLRLFAIFIVAAVWYVTIIDTAAVRSEKFADQLQHMALDVDPENYRTQRASEVEGEAPAKRLCRNQPCGWAVYTPFTREFNYFFKNVCECPDDTYRCIRTEDDLSANAYVHRCRQNTTADDIGPPEDDYFIH